jgi:hypothetical protein
VILAGASVQFSTGAMEIIRIRIAMERLILPYGLLCNHPEGILYKL